MASVGVGGRDLAAHSVGVAAPAAGARGTVVGSLAQGKAQPGRRVAAEAGQAERQKPHGSPAGAGMARGAGARPVSTVVLIILGRAVVEEALDAAEACAILHHALGRAQAALATSPAGWQATGRAALVTLAAATPFTDKQVEAPLGLILRQTLAEGHVSLEFAFGLGTNHHRARVGRCQTGQKPLFRGSAGPRHGRAHSTGASELGGVSMLLTLTAGQSGAEG